MSGMFLPVPRSCCAKGSVKRKIAPLTRRALDPDSTALRLYQALSDRQAEACAGSQTLFCASPR
jgi:hypothetical protein